MSRNYPKYKAAATQIAPVYLNLQASVDKACRYIEEAAANGAKIIGFPEAYLTGYTEWTFMGAPFPYGMEFYHKLYKNAFEIPGPEMAQIANCARDNHIYVCMSGTELDHGSLYLTQVWFDCNGNIMGKHRKLRPTSQERTIWGEGDGSMMPVFETELGNLGGLMCWEHRMPCNLMVMNAKNEQVHVSGWPTGQGGDDHMFGTDKNVTASKYYAATTGTYVLMCSLVYDETMKQELCKGDPELEARFGMGGGHGGIINPRGTIVTEMLDPCAEGILYADIDLEEIIDCKYFIDCAGHYSKANVTQLVYNQDPQDGVLFKGEARNTAISFEDLTK